MILGISKGSGFEGLRFTDVHPNTKTRKLLTQAAQTEFKESIDALEKQGVNFEFLKDSRTKNIVMYSLQEKADEVNFIDGKACVKVNNMKQAKDFLEKCIASAKEFLSPKIK